MYEKRPVLKLNYSTFEKIMEIISAGAIIFNFLLILSYWTSIPDRIVTHYGLTGKPDFWGGKSSLLILPGISAFLFLLLSIISRFTHIYNYPVTITEENAEYQYRNARMLIICIKAEIICAFLYISWKSIYLALGKTNALGIAFLPVFLIIIFGTLIYFIRKSIKLK